MSSFNKVDFLKALQEDNDFARDVATLLAPHIIEVVEINASQSDNGNIEYIAIELDKNHTSDRLINTMPYRREVEKVAHSFWSKFENEKRNFPSRSDFVKELQTVVLGDLISDLPITLTETKEICSNALTFFKKSISHFYSSSSDAKELVTKVRIDIETYRKSVKVKGL